VAVIEPETLGRGYELNAIAAAVVGGCSLQGGVGTIQGTILLFDASNGSPLASIDSMAVTALRTAAASAIAARHLARPETRCLLVCGCGAQAAAQLRALLCVRKPQRVLAYDLDAAKATRFVAAMQRDTGVDIRATTDLRASVVLSDMIVTCTTARRYFIARDMVQAGTFIAAVGADNDDKQEIDPALLAHAKVVTDLTAQAARIGDLHHAIECGAMRAGDVHAQLGEVAAGLKPGRTTEQEITIFDSTGTGLQDVAAAVAVYRAAGAGG